MKDFLLLLRRINKNASKFRIYDVVIILFLLNIVAITISVFYIQRLYFLSLPSINEDYLKINSIALPKDLEGINASASAYVVYDVSSRRVIAGKNHSLRFSPASTAKVMTAHLALKKYKLEEYLTVPFDIYSVEGSKMHLAPGEQISVINLLYGLMLPSGNDAAYTLAYYYPGGLNGFVQDMNEEAKRMQLTNTHFEDPSGYQDGNYTTAEELSRLASYVMEHKVFSQIVKTRSIEVANFSQSHTYYLKNLNELLRYPEVVGIKTGFTNEAGGVLLTAIQKNGKLFIVCVLKSPDRFSDTKDIMEFIHEKIDFAVPNDIN